MENFKKIFNEVLIENLGLNTTQIVPDARFKEDLHADSLEMIEIIMELEKRFEIDIPDEKAEEIKTVEQAERYLMQRLNLKTSEL